MQLSFCPFFSFWLLIWTMFETRCSKLLITILFKLVWLKIWLSLSQNCFKWSNLCEVNFFLAKVSISWFSDRNASWKWIFRPKETFKVRLEVRHQGQNKASLSSFDIRALQRGSHAPERYLTPSHSLSHPHSPAYRSYSPVCVLKYSWLCSHCHLRISKWEAQGREKSSYYEIFWSSTNVKAVLYKLCSITSHPSTVTISPILISTPKLLCWIGDAAIQAKWIFFFFLNERVPCLQSFAVNQIVTKYVCITSDSWLVWHTHTHSILSSWRSHWGKKT